MIAQAQSDSKKVPGVGLHLHQAAGRPLDGKGVEDQSSQEVADGILQGLLLGAEVPHWPVEEEAPRMVPQAAPEAAAEEEIRADVGRRADPWAAGRGPLAALKRDRLGPSAASKELVRLAQHVKMRTAQPECPHKKLLTSPTSNPRIHSPDGCKGEHLLSLAKALL